MKSLIDKLKIKDIYSETFLKTLFMLKANNAVYNIRTKLKYQIDDKNKDAITKMFDSFILNNTDKSIIAEGNVGVGKTIAFQIFQDVLSDLARAGHEYLKQQIFNIALTTEIVSDFQENGAEGIRKYKNNTWLFDDLGKEETEANHFGTKKKVLSEIIAYRYDLWKAKGIKTFFTSNYSLTHTSKEGKNFFKEKYGAHIYDRLIEMTSTVTFKGESRRQK